MEVSNQNINAMSDGEDEKDLKMNKEQDIKQTEEKAENEVIPDKNIAFSIFKEQTQIAKDIEASILHNSEELKQKKNIARDLLESSNESKSKIEELKHKLNEKKTTKLSLGVFIFSNIFRTK